MARSRFSRLLARLRGGAAGADGDEGDTTTRNKQRDYPGTIEEARERGIPIYVPFDTPSVASGPIRYEDDDPDKPDPYAALSDDVNTKAGESLEAATHHGESPGAPSAVDPPTVDDDESQNANIREGDGSDEIADDAPDRSAEAVEAAFERARPEIDRAKRQIKDAREKARACLPCSKCGSTKAPLIRKPRRGSLEWWDDPGCYIGCADCGAFFDLLDNVTGPLILQPEVPSDLEPDPNPSPNPRDWGD